MAINDNFNKRMRNMNEDILKGKWQEVIGKGKEKFGKFSDNDLVKWQSHKGLLPK